MPLRLKVEDVRQLQELLAEHAEQLEAGLKVLDLRVLLGAATVDLVALDAQQALVLVALGLAADDELLVRGLEAYSWALEYPDAVRRLYPMVRVSATDPPRLVFVAERMPDAFLRKVKHLRLPRVACLEFRLGLELSAVPGPRGLEERPGRVDAAPARGGFGDDRSAPETDDGAWRRGLAPTAELDEPRAAVVREYLQREFPTAVIYDFYDHDRRARIFHLQDAQGSVIHTAAVALEVLEAHGERELRGFLERHRVARVLRQAGQAAVAVTAAGVKIERR